MHIYVDESGNFLRKADGSPSFSCVGAVVCASRTFAKLERDFSKITENWPRKDGELKGSVLSETHIADLCGLLERYSVLFEATVIDIAMCDQTAIYDHKHEQARMLTEYIDERYSPEVVQRAHELRELCARMPDQLYAQYVLMTDLVWHSLEHGMLYWVQRWPGELARFKWVIDSKNAKDGTPFEKWWYDAVLAFLQSKSLREPLSLLQGADYSALTRNFPLVPMPSYLPIPKDKRRPLAQDLGAILRRDITFGSSHDYVGLQIADILTNALRRALLGHLTAKGWEPMRRLMIHNEDRTSIHFIAIGDGPDGSWASERRIKMLSDGRRNMLTQENYVMFRKGPKRKDRRKKSAALRNLQR